MENATACPVKSTGEHVFVLEGAKIVCKWCGYMNPEWNLQE